MSTYRDTMATELLRELREAGIPVEYVSFEDRSRGSYIVIYLYTGEEIKLRTQRKWYLIGTSQLAGDIADLKPQGVQVEPKEIQEILEEIGEQTQCPICGLRLNSPLALALHIYYKHRHRRETSNTKNQAR